jgi:hypothetical protein
MKNEYQNKQKKFDKLISDLNTNITCNVIVATKIQDSSLFIASVDGPVIVQISDLETEKYKIGIFNDKNVYIDPYLKIDDLRIFDDNKNELINLSNFEFDYMGLIDVI